MKFKKRIGVIMFSIIGIIFVLTITIGSVTYYANEIQGADWRKISFYSCLIIPITWRLGEFLKDLINLIFEKNKED